MIVRFTSTYDSCHGIDCMIVRFTSTYCSCHGHDCMIVGFTSPHDCCHGHDCIIVGCTSRYGGCHGHDMVSRIMIMIMNRYQTIISIDKTKVVTKQQNLSKTKLTN
jgi:hypothetical protein